MIKRLYILFLLQSISFAGMAQYEQIEKNFDSCFATAKNTKEQLDCINDYSLMWQKEIQRLDSLLLEILPKKMCGEFKKSRKLWLKFYRHEFKMLDTYDQFSSDEKTYQVIINHLKAEMFKRRATQLEMYYSILNM